MNRHHLVGIVLGTGAAMLATLTVVQVAQALEEPPGAAPPAASPATAPADAAPAATATAGSVVSSEVLHDLPAALTDRGVRGWSVTYWSATDEATGPDTGEDLVQVTGLVLAPAGLPPTDGRPVLAIAHGTTGIDPGCGPSLTEQRSTSLNAALPFLDAGLVVSLTDYRGLGETDEPVVHHYLDNRTAALDVIDSVRAARELVPEAADRWLAYGHSQGGGAAWAANELAPDYAPELDLLGTASAAGTIDVRGWAGQAFRGELGQVDMTVLQYLLESESRLDPGLDLSDLRSARGAELWGALSGGCDGDTAARTDAAGRLQPGDIGPQDADAVADLTQLLAERAQPQGDLSAPLLVVVGGRDELIDEAWTQRAVARARALSLGVAIDVERQPEAGHANLDLTNLRQWLLARAGS